MSGKCEITKASHVQMVLYFIIFERIRKGNDRLKKWITEHPANNVLEQR